MHAYLVTYNLSAKTDLHKAVVVIQPNDVVSDFYLIRVALEASGSAPIGSAHVISFIRLRAGEVVAVR